MYERGEHTKSTKQADTTANRRKKIMEENKQTNSRAWTWTLSVCRIESTTISDVRAPTSSPSITQYAFISFRYWYLCMRHNRACAATDPKRPEKWKKNTKVNGGENIERQKIIIKQNIHWKIMHKMVNGKWYEVPRDRQQRHRPANYLNSRSDISGRRGSSTNTCTLCMFATRGTQTNTQC